MNNSNRKEEAVYVAVLINEEDAARCSFHDSAHRSAVTAVHVPSPTAAASQKIGCCSRRSQRFLIQNGRPFLLGTVIGVAFGMLGFYLQTLATKNELEKYNSHHQELRNESLSSLYNNSNNNGGQNIEIDDEYSANWFLLISYSILWSVLTTVVACSVFHFIYLGKESAEEEDQKKSAAADATGVTTTRAVTTKDDAMMDPIQLEYSYAVGVFFGFCGACTMEDIAFGVPTLRIILISALSLSWAASLIRCTMACSSIPNNNDKYDDVNNEQSDKQPLILVV